MGKRFGLCALLMIMLLVLSACGVESKYNNALGLMSKGNYAKAAKTLESISDYEDAADMAVYCNACAIAEKGDYATAVSMLKSISHFKDSSVRATYYNGRAYEQYAGTENMEYLIKALNSYSTTPDFLDCAERATAMAMRIENIKKAQYDAAVEAGENGQYATAEKTFTALNNYSDSQTRIVYYRIRENEVNLATDASQDAFMNVSQEYVGMGDYLDCSERANALQTKADAVVQSKCAKIDELINAGRYDDAANKLAEFGIYGSEKVKEKYYAIAEKYVEAGQWAKASIAFKRACPHEDALKRAYEIEYHYLYKSRIAAGYHYSVGVRPNGTVLVARDTRDNRGQPEVAEWTDIVAVVTGEDHTVGLKADGTVVAAGEKDDGRCDVSDWTDIVAVWAAGEYDGYTIGLKSDGTVMTTGSIYDGIFELSAWNDIVAIGIGTGIQDHAIGLRADGTVVAVGSNHSKQCEVSDWTNIIDIVVSEEQTMGLKADGTVVYTGSSRYLQEELSTWTDIVDIALDTNEYYPAAFGLKSDGTVVAVGYHDNLGKAGWTDIVAFTWGESHILGLKSDGSVVMYMTSGTNRCDGCMNVSEWNLLEGAEQTEQVTGVQTEQDSVPQPVATPRVTTTSQPVVTPSPQQTAAPTKKATATPKPTAVPTKRATATPKPTTMPKALRIGDIVTMGTYEQDNRKNNGTEAIEWQVIDIQGNKALLISRYVLDHVDYHTKQTSVTWESCYMRRWLNSEFIQTAFNANEQEMILTTIVKAQKNPHLSTEPKNGIGNDTQDKIFLLNVVEAEKYFDSDWDRQCKGTEYALDQNVSTDGVYCNWLLRQPHKSGTTVPCVNFEGSTNDGVNVSAERTGMRPAMWIDVNLLPGYSSIGK